MVPFLRGGTGQGPQPHTRKQGKKSQFWSRVKQNQQSNSKSTGIRQVYRCNYLEPGCRRTQKLNSQGCSYSVSIPKEGGDPRNLSRSQI